MSSCKYLFVLFAFIVISRFDPTQASIMNDKENDKKYIAFEETLDILKQFEKFQPITGNLSTESTDTAPTKFFTSDEVDTSAVKLLLYTNEQPDGRELDYNNLEEIEFNPSNPTRMICHGWLSSAEAIVVKGIANAYLKKGDNNVISVDWSAYSKDILYPLPVKNTEGVGKYVADIIDNLVEKRGAQYSDFHVIGHSLGAHVAGYAGSNTKEKIGRITGLDPALPGFQYLQGREGRLDDTDATFVDVIHTCSGVLGMSVPVGHVDFFPNGGSPFQPGCGSILLTHSNLCSHGRAYLYFSESIINATDFTAVKCEDWDHFKSHDCDESYELMGENVSRDARGVYYLNTNDEAPYGKGKDGTVY